MIMMIKGLRRKTSSSSWSKGWVGRAGLRAEGYGARFALGWGPTHDCPRMMMVMTDDDNRRRRRNRIKGINMKKYKGHDNWWWSCWTSELHHHHRCQDWVLPKADIFGHKGWIQDMQIILASECSLLEKGQGRKELLLKRALVRVTCSEFIGHLLNENITKNHDFDIQQTLS